MTQPIWNPEGLLHYPLIEHVHVAPDGQHVLFTVRRPHTTDSESEFRDQVYVVATAPQDRADTPGSPPRQLTWGLGASSPKWSPDGTMIAFIRRHHAGGQQARKIIWIMDVAGGEPRPLVPPEDGPNTHEDVQLFEWRPDSKAIALRAVPTDAERRRRKRQKDDVLQWRVDYDRAHLYVVELGNPAGTSDDPTPETPSPAQAATENATWQRVTEGPFHVESFAWHPLGIELAYIAQDTPYIESWPSSRLVRSPFAPDSTGQSSLAEPIHVADTGCWKSKPGYSPDGKWLACEMGSPENRWAYAGRMHIFPLTDPTGADQAGAKQTGGAQALAQVSDAQPGFVGWTAESSHVLVADEQGLGTAILALPIDGEPPRYVVEPDQPSAVFHVNAGGILAQARQDHHQINSVFLLDLGQLDLASQAPTGPDTEHGAPQTKPRLLCTPHAPDYPQGPLPQIQELRWQTDDGFEIEGVLYLPADYDAQSGEKLPFLLHIHGGPMGVFQRTYAGAPYYYNAAALCESGFAVLRCNPRGSSGYGRDFRFANIRDWGGGDYRDLMQGVDTVIEMGIADPDRLGVCGWSYGGFMSSWIITQTHRFKVASIGAPVTNPMSFSATSDIPGFIPDYYGAEAWEDFEFYQAHSPISHAHKVQTPAIIQHGDADERVPLEQGLQYYYVLKRINVPVELYIYPRQGHAIQEPRLLAHAIRCNQEWFGAQLLDLDQADQATT